MDSGESGGRGELILHGLPASGGIAIGPAFVYSREELQVVRRQLAPGEVEHEITLLHESMARVEEELQTMVDFARSSLGDDLAAIFESQILMVNDVELIGAIERRVRDEQVNADFLIAEEIERYAGILAAAGSANLGLRSEDLREAGQRLLRSLQKKRLHHTIESEHAVVASNLTPGDTLLFSRSDVLAYITDQGGLTSHTAILARSLKIPAVVATGNATELIHPGDLLVVDGHKGVVIVNPTQETIARHAIRREEARDADAALREIIELPGITTDGHRVDLCANAEFVSETGFVLSQGAMGIGLYRTEHLTIEKGDFPSEQEQAIAYTEVAHSMHPSPVTFRTFDIGGDKFIEGWVHEDNPFLGWRGIRLLLDLPDIFRQQLRAILRASSRKNARIMFPMISSVDEIRQARQHIGSVMEELQQKGIPFDAGIQIGIMIEVPSSVIIADALAREVDFFSIGTNDLTQYLIAVDRNNEHILDLYQEFHPAVLRAVRHIIDTGHASGIRVGMCGEMAGNPVATVLLLGLGLDEFSMVPSMLPEIKKIIRSVSMLEARDIADACMRLTSVHDIKSLLTGFALRRFPELITTNNHNGNVR